MKLNAPLAFFLVLFLYSGFLQAQTPTGGWGNCEFATVATMDAFNPSGSTFTCKKAYITATDEHYRWDGSAWVLASADVENIYNTSDSLISNRTLSLADFSLDFDLNKTGEFSISDNGSNVFNVADNGYIGLWNNNPSYRLHANNTTDINPYYFVSQNGLTGEKDVFTIEDKDVGGGGQDHSSVLKIWKSANVNNGDLGFSLAELTYTGAYPGTDKYWISGRKTNERTPEWGVELHSNQIWSNGGILLNAIGSTDGSYSGGDFIVQRDGDVGIGTAAPNTRLEVAGGTIRFSEYGDGTYDTGNETYILGVEVDGDVVEIDPASLGSSDNIYTTDGTLGADRTVDMDGNDLTFDATSDVVIKSSGRVGLGTAGPTQMLDVAGANKVQIGTFAGGGGGKLRVDIAAAETEAQGIKVMNLRNSGNNYGVNGTSIGVGATTNTGLYGWAEGATNNYGLWVEKGYGIVDDSMAIGTLIPEARLHVKEGTNFNSVFIAESENTASWSRTITGLTPNVPDGSVSGLFTFGQSDASREAGHLYFVDDATDGEEYIGFAIRSGAWDILNMTGAGDVGIGTSTPDAKLDVEGGTVRLSEYGDGTYDTGNETYILGVELDGDVVEIDPASLGGSSDNIYNTNVTLTADRTVNLSTHDLTLDATADVVVKNSGRIGMGTSDPDGPLHIVEATGTAASATAGSIILEHANSGGSNSIIFKSTANPNSDYAYIQYSDDGSGNGTTAENSLLTIGIENDVIDTPWQDDIAIMPSGHLGVGTTTPAAKLDVAGSVRFSDHGTGTTYLDTASASTPAEIDYVLGVNSDGDVLEMNTAKSSKVFYAPAIVVDASARGTGFTLDLHKKYSELYAAPAVVSSGAPTAIPSYASDELYYYVLDFDGDVFSGLSIDEAGILSYNIDEPPVDNCSVFNVVFVVK